LTRSSDQDFRDALEEIESNFLSYQRRYINAERVRLGKGYRGPLFLGVEKAVRTGFTYSHSYKHSKKRALRHPNLPKINELFASKSLLTAMEYRSYHVKWAEMWNTLKPGLIPIDKWTQTKCVYPGGDIMIVSSEPNAFRGMQGDISLDEFAFHDSPDELFATAQSRTLFLPEGQISVFSSHSHPETTFARLMSAARRGRGPFGTKEGMYFRVTMLEAVADGLALKADGDHRRFLVPDGNGGYTPESRELCDQAFIERIRSTCATEDDWFKEYMCEHSRTAQLVQEAEYDALLAKQPIPDSLDWSKAYNPLYVGIDFGRTKDLTVVWVWEHGIDPNEKTAEYMRDVLRPVCVLAMFNTQYNVQLNRIKQLLSHPQIQRVSCDQGVLGGPLTEALKDDLGSIIEAIAIGPSKKGPLMEDMRGMIHQKRVLLPDDGDIRSDFLSMRRVPPAKATTGGMVKYEGGTLKTHGDYYCAAALGLDAARKAAGITLALAREEEW
jgi:phage FluMu gp28-like protein